MIAEKVYKKLLKLGFQEADVAIIAGSGLKNSVPNLKDKVVVKYNELKMPNSKVKGHEGEFIFGEINGKRIVVGNRYHFYESGDINLVRLPYEIFSLLKVKIVILLTASGAVDEELEVGDIILINDHINLTGTNPLINLEPIKFVDLSNAYDEEIIKNVKQISKQKGIKIKEGIHIQFSGPTYETAAEVDLARKIGAASVSMSTALDTIVCRFLNMKVLAMASISNKATNKKHKENISHEDVLKASNENSEKFKIIIEELLKMYKF